MLSEVKGNCLIVRSVGDHGLEEGFAQMKAAMDKAKAAFEASGEKIVMFLDMLESEEEKDPAEIRQISEFFKQFLGFLDGRIAVFVTHDLHYGLSRVFSAYTETDGLDVQPFFEVAAAAKFLGQDIQTLRSDDQAS